MDSIAGPTRRKLSLRQPLDSQSDRFRLHRGPMRRATSNSRARPSLRAVLYHHVTDHACSLVDRLAVSTPPNAFEAHVRKLARDYQFVSLGEVLSGELPRRALLITFDDGYRSVAEVALPILRRLDVPSVFFITGACLERDS